MSDFSSFTGKFRVQQQPSITKVTKRPRASHVCDQCRKSRLRCDRAQPCGSCTKRNVAGVCSYRQAACPTKVAGDNHQHSVEGRLAHLESLITDLMGSHELGAPKNGDINSHISHVQDGQKVDANSYAGFTHWSAVLDDIQELKTALGGSAEGTEVERLDSSTGDIIFGSPGLYSLPEITAQYLPPKIETDRLLSVYFQGQGFIIPFIHTQHFQRQYREFWADPSTVNPLWLSMLFSICCLACLIREKAEQVKSVPESSAFHTAAGKCLVIGEYHRPQTFAVESLSIYAQYKILRTLDPSPEAGTLLGMVVRLAYKMGYHRDPDHLESSPSLTVFEGEMRRRFWAACKQIDVMTSFQLGLPSNICLENCDIKSPRNLLDSDFDTDTQIVPPSRSEDEATKMLWFIVKDRQLISFSKVCQDALSFRDKSEADIRQLDADIRKMHATVPGVLRTRPFAESIADEAFLIMSRIYIEFIHLKSLCILHRKYMARGNAFSAKACIEAGKQLVGQFIDMFNEFSPGGRLHAERWMLTSFTMNDFLFGIMVLCLVVHTYRKGVLGPPIVDSSLEYELLRLLGQSLDICVEKSSVCKDARRVSHVVRLILKGPNMSMTLSNEQGVLSSVQEERRNTSHIDAMSLDLIDPFGLVDNGFENLDWFPSLSPIAFP